MLDASSPQHLLLAETLGLAMARRACDILDRHRAALAGGGTGTEVDDDQFALDNAVFTAVLDAANECLGRFDTRPADEDPRVWPLYPRCRRASRPIPGRRVRRAGTSRPAGP
jgi:hypothetical protein